MDEAMTARVRHAVEEVHADLGLWLGSDAPSSVFERFISVLHPRFSMVGTSGEIVSRDELVTGLAQAGNSVPGMTIGIEDITVLAADADSAVVRFTEIHRHPEGGNTRRVTAVLTADVSVEEGLRWLSVHETAVEAD